MTRAVVRGCCTPPPPAHGPRHRPPQEQRVCLCVAYCGAPGGTSPGTTGLSRAPPISACLFAPRIGTHGQGVQAFEMGSAGAGITNRMDHGPGRRPPTRRADIPRNRAARRDTLQQELLGGRRPPTPSCARTPLRTLGSHSDGRQAVATRSADGVLRTTPPALRHPHPQLCLLRGLPTHRCAPVRHASTPDRLKPKARRS